MSTTTYRFPVLALYEEVVALLESAGVGESADVQSRFGRKHIAELGKAPRYVWVPLKTTDRATFATRGADGDESPDESDWRAPEHRAIGYVREHVEVGCWGRSYAEAWALRQNLLVACDRLASIDVRVESGSWSKASAAHNQLGELYVVELSIAAAVQDAYVPIPTLEVPDPDVVTPVSVEGYVATAEDIDAVEDEPQLQTST